MKNRLLVVLAACALALGHAATSTTLASSGAVLVSNNLDSGQGSFRDAIDQANADPGVTHIQFTGAVSVIALQQSVIFTGPQALAIDGNGAALDGSGIALGAAFLATGGGDLAISRLTVRDAPAEGIAVEVPADATGTAARLALSRRDPRQPRPRRAGQRPGGLLRARRRAARTRTVRPPRWTWP